MTVLEKNRIGPEAADTITLDGGLNVGIDAGVADAYMVAVTPPLTGLRAGLTVFFSASNANTGAATINVNNLGVAPLVFSSGADLIKGAVPAGYLCQVMFDGAKWVLLNPAKTGADMGAISMFISSQT